jgi:excisionase family DNA binding protein
MAQKYYSSSEAAKVLGKTVEQVKQMLERRELHGYRDGADWKFKVEDIDRLAKASPAATPAADDDVGDVLLSEVELGQSDPGLSGTVIGLNAAGRLAVDSDIRLAESDLALSALNEGSTETARRKAASTAKGPKGESSELLLGDELKLGESPIALSGMSGKAAGGSSAIEIGGRESEDDLVLGGSGTGSDVTLGGDSGISLIDPSDSGFSLETPVNLSPAAEESLELGEDDVAMAARGAATLKTDDEFLLTPLEETIDTEGSESGSQVIALDSQDSGVMVGTGSEVSMAAMLDEDVSAQPSLDMGMAAPLAGSPVLAAQPAVLTEGAAVMQAAYLVEPPYTGWQITGLTVCAVLLVLCGMMTLDLLRCMWSYEQPFAITSGLMNTILGWIGL